MNITFSSLKESNDFLNLILESINSAVFIVDKDNKITNVNNVFISLFNTRSSVEIIGELFGNAVNCINLEKECGDSPYCSECDLRNSIREAFSLKNGINSRIIEKEFKSGELPVKKIFQMTIKYIRYNDNDMVIVILDDITELETQKIRLEELNREKNRILGIAAHDLRNPISIIQIYSEFILDRMNNNLTDEQKKFINQIYKTSYVMLNLLQDILDISKIESGVINLVKLPVNYLEFLKNSIEPNYIIAQKKNIDIIFENGEISELTVHFDENRMTQVINNLLSNAIKFSNPGTKIFVRVSTTDRRVLTEVIDTGLGIPENDKGKIFHPFHKGSFKPTGDEPQTGLGLAIVKKIIEAHGGTIDFESEINRGSNFYFYLPIND